MLQNAKELEPEYLACSRCQPHITGMALRRALATVESAAKDAPTIALSRWAHKLCEFDLNWAEEAASPAMRQKSSYGNDEE